MKRFAIASVLVLVAMLIPSLAEAHGGRGRVQVNVGQRGFGGFNGGVTQINVGRRGRGGSRGGFAQINVGHGFRQQSVFLRQPVLFVPQQQVLGNSYGYGYGYGLQQQVITLQSVGGCNGW